MYETFWRWDARRRFASVVSCGVPRLMYAIDGVLCRRRDVYLRGSRRRFASAMLYVTPRVMYR
jgi:hypothetical protein